MGNNICVYFVADGDGDDGDDDDNDNDNDNDNNNDIEGDNDGSILQNNAIVTSTCAINNHDDD